MFMNVSKNFMYRYVIYILYIHTYIHIECNNCLYSALYRHILLYKYDCHIAYASHTSNILKGYVNPTLLHMC